MRAGRADFSCARRGCGCQFPPFLPIPLSAPFTAACPLASSPCLPNPSFRSLALCTPFLSLPLPSTPFHSLPLPSTPFLSLPLPSSPFLSLPLPLTPSIDFGEFASILKGVKASNAATVIERQYHAHQKSESFLKEKEGTQSERRRRRKALNKPAVAALVSPRSAAMPIATGKEELERLLGNVLVRKQADPKLLVEKWDRKRKGAITRIEFRVGVREGLGLHADNAAIDAFFEHFDKDGSGSIDVPELRDGLDWLRSRAEAEEARHTALMELVASMQAKVDSLTPGVLAAEQAHAAAFEADGVLAAHRALPHIDATVGAKLLGKMRSDDNPKGSSVDDLVAAWNVSKEVSGFMGKAEFVKAVGALLEGVTLKRQKSEASQLKLDAALTLEAKEKVRAEWAIKEALGETAQADVEAEFDALDAYFASGGEAASWQGALAASEAQNGAAPPALTGTLPIEPLIVALMAAERARVVKDAKLVAECAARKDAALAAQAAIKQAALDFEGREKAEADAAEAAAEAARAAEAEAKAKEKEAKAKAKEEAATAPMKGAVQPRWLDSAQQEANGGAAPSSAGAAPVDAPAAVW